MVIKKVIIPSAGLGTRLLPITKEIPKEMLPIFSRRKNQVYLKPMLQQVFEQLFDSGFREFCFIVGRGKRAIEDHFTPDWNFVVELRNKDKEEEALELEAFYQKIQSSVLVFVNQPRPAGLGDAVLRAKTFTRDENFVVHAGDDLILSRNLSHITRLVRSFDVFKADAAFLADEIKDPTKYGVIEGQIVSKDTYKVAKIVEKPKVPPSNITVIAIYAFSPKIYEQLKETQPNERGQIELSDAIQRLIENGHKVFALRLTKNEKRIDIGNILSYWNALETTRKFSLGSLTKTDLIQ